MGFCSCSPGSWRSSFVLAAAAAQPFGNGSNCCCCNSTGSCCCCSCLCERHFLCLERILASEASLRLPDPAAAAGASAFAAAFAVAKCSRGRTSSLCTSCRAICCVREYCGCHGGPQYGSRQQVLCPLNLKVWAESCAAAVAAAANKMQILH